MPLFASLLAVIVLLTLLALLALIERAVLGLRAATHARALQDQARALRAARTVEVNDPLLAETLARDLFTAPLPAAAPRLLWPLVRRPRTSRGSAPPSDEAEDQAARPDQRSVLSGSAAAQHRKV